MARVAFGIKSMKVGGIDETTGLPTSLTDVGRIYRDTGSWTEEDGPETMHYAEREQDPVITIREQGVETLNFSLMDTPADVLVLWAGGTVTEVVDEPDVWNKPRAPVNIEKSIEIETDDGTVFTIHRAKIYAKRNLTPTRNGIFLLEISARPLTPLVANVPPVTIADPPAA
jgi:hypothetical protein